MPRSLSYADAARLLGGQHSRIVTALEKSAGWLMLGTVPGAGEVLSWFDAKGELVRLSHDLVRDLSERRSGLSRYDRTERLEAAHTVIAVAAFFEALDDADLPSRFSELIPTRPERLTLAGGGAVTLEEQLMESLRSIGDLLPNPQRSPEKFLQLLHLRYAELGSRVKWFTRGLAHWERLPATDQERFDALLEALPERACRRYEESFRRLVAEFPEVACWAGAREHRATRAALADMEELLQRISSGRLPDERRQSLAAANRAELNRRVAESGEVPDGIRMPSLGEAYVPPRFRASNVLTSDRISAESWWAGLPARADLEDFLIGHLTSPQAVRAPLLVLGQPGSGKSVLTRVLAARLPAADFMPVRVVLRDVPTADELQLQIEHAIRLTTGERIEWPALARSAGGALPVVILDGFDELLQAVGVTQTDYLLKVARFQEREAELNRPLAVVVTTRTAVADRARPPEGTVAIRLDPFDDGQVTTWLDIWNQVNAANFAAQQLRPLPAKTVLAHRALAEQPLLLLMLALYDTNANTLQKAENNLQAHELYEELLRSFATREILKHRPGLSARERQTAVESELRRLSVVAFAMFNRAALWVTEADLDRDLAALPFGGPQHHSAGTDLRTPLGAAELTLGRFFFIHQARASQDQENLLTYEFLHATFAEYFVARLTWQVVNDVAARQSASMMSFDTGPADDDLLRVLLSFEPLSLRAPVMEFLHSLVESADETVRDGIRKVALRLYRSVNHTPPTARFADYRPQRLSEPARYATYAANLLLISLCTGVVHGRELYPEQRDPVDSWHAQALLWRSQLSTDGWTSLVYTATLERIGSGPDRDIRLGTHLDLLSWDIDPAWTFSLDPQAGGTPFIPSDLDYLAVRRKAHFQCGVLDDMIHHAIGQVPPRPGAAVDHFALDGNSRYLSTMAAMLRITTAREDVDYMAAADFAGKAFQPWDVGEYTDFVRVLLTRLSTDTAVDAATAMGVLRRIADQSNATNGVFDSFLQVVLRFLGQDRNWDRGLVAVLNWVAATNDPFVDPVLLIDAEVRAFELDLLTSRPPGANVRLLDKIRYIRPDLVVRYQRLLQELQA
ncbi:NACHT domain-containing protein [Actinoplanes derwentensis]|uniref:NACHT N-terminal Helical domain-containing protein n=1 Tax=Actinoplanes derwentensis TaxID=113562 RepID=A0A1H2AFF3_9ACTN|nr:hypothetical protein [Actinoplanes derwentensis]GID88229.1 hypothetical protein Ade03nite_71530 [Actinoplanes derwentensis]SDT44226.1 hypothetical protein SAMN04489716_3810 [Actinoplanes derwentensis]